MSLRLSGVQAPTPKATRGLPFPLAEHPTRPLLAYPHGRNVYVMAGGEVKLVYATHAHPVRTVRWSPHGRHLYSADERGHLCRHDPLEDENQMGRAENLVVVVQRARAEWETGLPIHDFCVLAKLIVLVGECQVSVLKMEGGGGCSPLPGHTQRINQIVQVGDDNVLLTASDDLTLGVYQVKSNDDTAAVEFVRTLRGLHTRPIHALWAVTLADHPFILTGGADGKLNLLDGRNLLNPVTPLWSSHPGSGGGSILSIKATGSNDKAICSLVGTDGCLREWSLAMLPTPALTLLGERQLGSQLLAVAPLSRLVVSLDHGLQSPDQAAPARKLSIATMPMVKEGQVIGVDVPGLAEPAYSVALGADGLVCVGLNRALLVGGVRVGIGLGPITAVAIGPAYIAVADAERRVRLLDRETLQPLEGIRWCHHAARVTAMAWHQEWLATVSLDGQLALLHPSKPLAPRWQAPTGQGCLSHAYWLTGAAELNQQPTLVTVGEQDTRLWQLAQ